MRRLLASLPGLSTGTSGQTYYYPRRGFGQICTRLAQKVSQLGGHLHLGAHVKRVQRTQNRASRLEVRLGDASDLSIFPVAHLFSTIPLTALTAIMPWLDRATRDAASRLRYRAMVYCYLLIETDRFTPYDAHYFPESKLTISRLSEPKNYSVAIEPKGLTGLCAELPCWPTDTIWRLRPQQVAQKVLAELARAELPVTQPVSNVFVRRQRHAYPVYDLGFDRNLHTVEAKLGELSGFTTLGRQGLFAQDNIHHAFEMARAAADCLGPASAWDAPCWTFSRETFRQHVVVD
jgi:protoporphyrinogen oxidase